MNLFIPVCLACLAMTLHASADDLQSGFTTPPASAKARTWWHWLNGHVSKEGITADLEAMKRVGIHEAQIFNVDMGYPEGSAAFLSREWLELFHFAASEAKRLGLEIGFHNGAGWSSSGGPWVMPEYAMQTVVYSEFPCTGGKRHTLQLPHPPTRLDHYRDIAVWAFPKPQGAARIDDLELKSLSGHSFRNHLYPDTKPVDPASLLHKVDMINLTSKLSADGTLEWDAPAGEWIILRLGHTPTGAENGPAVAGGRGLECDKMSRAAVDAYWNGGIQPILDKLDTLVGSSLTNCLIDSYEVGCTNWTDGFREAFMQRRGYDCLPFLPALAGYYMESGEITERFLWDFRRTIGDLIAENYYGRFRELCHAYGMRFSVEPYGGPFDCLQAGSAGDIVMGEFWLGDNLFFDSPKFVASIAHLNGNPIVGAEAFTGQGGWLNHPATLKAVGDKAWTEGVNRLIFHTYVHQPRHEAPGMTFGPYGIEMSRLNTWWEQGTAYMDYLARSQFLLQQGRNVADILVFTGESSPNDALLRPDIKALGYDYDLIGADKMASLTVRDGQIYTSAGGIYRMLILPETTWMTPEILKKIEKLAEAGATITGSKPATSPSLQGYPTCDDQVTQLANELWDSKRIRDCSFREVLNEGWLLPDFSAGVSGADLQFIHRLAGDADIYFVANSLKESRQETCCFRVTGKQPEFWDPETGKVREAVVWQEHENGTISLPVSFDPEGAVFVVFRKPVSSPNAIVRVKTELCPQEIKPLPGLKILKAEYGTFFPDGLADVTAAVTGCIQDGKLRVSVGSHLSSYDPAPGSIKELRVEYETGGRRHQVRALEHEQLAIETVNDTEWKVVKAVYGKFDRGLDRMPSHFPVYNVTEQIAGMVASNTFVIPVDDRLIDHVSDSSGRSQKKELRLVYTAEGETRQLTVAQGHKLSLAFSTPDPKLLVEQGKPAWITPYAGTLTYTTLSGVKKRVRVKSVPAPIELTGPWEVSFPPNMGAPSTAVFDQLISWPASPCEGIRYFSGTATYRKQVTLTKDMIRAGHSLELDLGSVRVIAEVIVNGKNLGIIWKAPFRIDLGNAVKEGTNELEIRITNLWPNRLIGDERLGEGASPSKRMTCTTWKHWNENSPLQSSGLLGPVIIRSYVHIFD
ncbi:MAG: hypothetical protein LBQ39_05495 [Tannerellaceae bacterium]|nr:hypothetical protein [Tannerellaceae bacterium]